MVCRVSGIVINMVCPTSFVSIGSKVKVRFIDGKEVRWYEGEITDIHERASNAKHGTYVVCSILYEDGDFHTDTELYDRDFDDETSLDAWKFSADEWNHLVHTLQDQQEDIAYVQEEVDEMILSNAKTVRRQRTRLYYLALLCVLMAMCVDGEAFYNLLRSSSLDTHLPTLAWNWFTPSKAA